MDYQGLLGGFGPTEDDQRQARIQGLLQAGLGILAANNQRNVGPALGAGGLMGFRGYQDALQQAQNQRMAQMAQGLKLAEFKRAEDQRRALARAFGGGGQGGFMQAGTRQPAGFNKVAAGDYLALGGDPAKLKAMEDMMAPTVRRLVEGGKIVLTDRYGNKVGEEEVTPAPVKPDYDVSDLTPEQARQYRLSKAARSATKVTLAPTIALGKKESEAKGEYNINKLYAPVQESAQVAAVNNAKLSGLDRIPLKTGKGVPLAAEAAGWLTTLGLGGEEAKALATDSQRFQAIAKDLVLQKQLAQKGPQTESDARRLEQTVAQLGNTPEANKFIIRFDMAQNNRAIEKAQFFDEYWNTKGTIEGAEKAWREGPGSRSVFDDPALKPYLGGPKKPTKPSMLPKGVTVTPLD